ncbi:hypothetical protein [Caulobacter sp. 1776]|uniref:hypothetical protein n=1 Tax=Caulobacter sp. 1776 TaxID=3156420 RepID=UPI0033917B2D
MSKFAENTTVSTSASRDEIERTLRRYKADAFMYAQDKDLLTIMFRIEGRMIRFELTMPDREADDFATYMRGSVRYQREPAAAEKLWEQACRQKWRALALVIKAKLEAVSAEISTIEDEFLAHTVLPDGSTVGDWAKPQLKIAYESGAMPTSLLLQGPSK